MSGFGNRQAEHWIEVQCALRNETIDMERACLPSWLQSYEAKHNLRMSADVYRRYLLHTNQYWTFYPQVVNEC